MRKKIKTIQLCLHAVGYFFYCFKPKCIYCCFSETPEETNTEITGALEMPKPFPLSRGSCPRAGWWSCPTQPPTSDQLHPTGTTARVHLTKSNSNLQNVADIGVVTPLTIKKDQLFFNSAIKSLFF